MLWSCREKVTRFTRPVLNDQLDLWEYGSSQAKPLHVCSTCKKIANMNSGLMLQRYGLKSGILYKCSLDRLTELLRLKMIKKVETTSLAKPWFWHLLMSSDQDWMPFLKAIFNQTQGSGLSTETNGLSSVVLSYAEKTGKVLLNFKCFLAPYLFS